MRLSRRLICFFAEFMWGKLRYTFRKVRTWLTNNAWY
jgi:hypothetical protein